MPYHVSVLRRAQRDADSFAAWLFNRSPTFKSALGGGTKKATHGAILNADVEGHIISTHAMVIEKIGNDEDDRPIDVLFGALAMQQWGIRLVPEEERLDMSHYPKEFVEF